jgi:hypothetical protein
MSFYMINTDKNIFHNLNYNKLDDYIKIIDNPNDPFFRFCSDYRDLAVSHQ